MTVELSRTLEDAKIRIRAILRAFKLKRRRRGYFYPVAVKLIFDPRDGPSVGMRGFSFKAEKGKTYYAIIDSPEDLPIFKRDIYSRILGIVY